MPKTKSKSLLEHFPPLRDIPEDEWDEIFNKVGEPWTEEDIDYVREWYGVVHVLEISYALGRPPWTIQAKAKNLQDGANVTTRKRRERR